MKLVSVSDTFAVSPQLEPSDMRGLADAGFGTVICNRPDGEEPCGPTAGCPAVRRRQPSREC
ncbi:MAG: hypothetical protein CME84_11205 [Henriciella sp.]|uniref:beta-lactamase hydrolase domain-containing protein n=1 Tax=Qipengyuania flava TaxID=192812 RepID=UPI000C4A0042|nr:hypothetical protein [Henriciella sp.]MAO03320.1 hypothetical protein [Citromicrobium sp.]